MLNLRIENPWTHDLLNLATSLNESSGQHEDTQTQNTYA